MNSDNDGIGDLCDLFPNNSDNELAQCELERDKALDHLNSCLSTPLFVDTDQEGEFDGTDKCPNTLPGATVDDSGCSNDQYCSQFNTSKSQCRHSDWNNDELTDRPKDCRAISINSVTFNCVAY